MGIETGRTDKEYLGKIKAFRRHVKQHYRVVNGKHVHVDAHTRQIGKGGKEKSARVRGKVKQYRRALEMLLNKKHSFHGSHRPDGALASREVQPGKVNALAKDNVPESYWGRENPDLYFAANDGVFAVPSKRVVGSGGRTVPSMNQSGPVGDVGNAKNWDLAAKPVPLLPKDTFVPGRSGTKAQVAAARAARMRVIGRKEFWDAHVAATKSPAMRRDMAMNRYKSLEELR